MSEVAMAAVLDVPAAIIVEAVRRLHEGLLDSGGGGAPVSALSVLNMFLPRLGGAQVRPRS